MDYNTAVAKLGNRDSRKIGNNTYLQRRSPNSIAVRLHETDILTFYPGRTVYNSGGWRTSTTKARMNEWGDQSARLFTERGVWYLARIGEWDKRMAYADGLTIPADGAITGQGNAPDERGDKRLVKRFVADYMAAFERGEVPAPGPGDCFLCGVLSPLGDVEHIRSHFEESYFVPRLLYNAMETFGASPASRNWIAAYWDTTAPEEARASVKGSDFYSRHGREVCTKMLRRYLLRQLGYAV